MWGVTSKKIVLIKNGVEAIKYIEKAIVRGALLARVHKATAGSEQWSYDHI